VYANNMDKFMCCYITKEWRSRMLSSR